MKPESQELERNVEARLVKRCKENGWYCRKFVSPGYRSVPDRVVVAPSGVYFVELKAPGEVPRKDQVAEHRELFALGANVVVLDTRRGVDACCKSIAASANENSDAYVHPARLSAPRHRPHEAQAHLWGLGRPRDG